MEVFSLSNSYNELMSRFTGVKPNEVDGVNNTSFFFYRNQLYSLIHSVFNFENVPDSWDVDYMLDVLFSRGYIGVVETPAGAVLPLECGYSGINVYRKPTTILVANPVIPSFQREIGDKGELLYINYCSGRFVGLENLVTRYATLLASCDCSLNATLINSRVAHVFKANNTSDLKTMQQIYDDVSMGKPAVFLRKGNTEIYEDRNEFINVKSSFIGKEIIDVKKEIKREFLTEIGIANAMEKRERSVSDELNINAGEVMSMVSLWLRTMKDCLKRINNTFNLNIDVNYNTNVIRFLNESEGVEYDA